MRRELTINESFLYTEEEMMVLDEQAERQQELDMEEASDYDKMPLSEQIRVLDEQDALDAMYILPEDLPF